MIIQHCNMQHFIHAKMLDAAALRFKGHQIIIIIIPCQRPRTDHIQIAVTAQLFFLFGVPIKIYKRNLLIGSDGGMNIVYIIINAFVHSFDTVGNIYLTIQLTRFVFTAQRDDFANQFLTFFSGDKFG